MLDVLRLRDARLYLLGQTLSLFGDSALYLALGIWVKTLTGSNAAAGLIFFVLALPALLAPVAGVVVDRVRRRPLMIATDLVIGLAVLLLLFVHGAGQLWLLYLVTALYGAAAVVFGAAQSAILRTLLPDALLGEGNAALQTVREALRIIAPLAGAGLFAALGGGAVATLDALTFAASALCLAALRVRETPPAREDREERFVAELAAGTRHILHTAALRQIVLSVAVALLVVGFSETLIFAVTALGLHRPPTFIGVLEAAQGMGAIAGGLSAATVMRRLGDARLIALGLMLFGLGDLALLSTALAVVLGGIVVAGFGLPWVVVGFGTALQRRTPWRLQGRVAAAAGAMVSTPQTLSIALGAALSTVIPYRLLVLAMSGGVALVGLYLFSRPITPPPADEAAAEGAREAVAAEVDARLVRGS